MLFLEGNLKTTELRARACLPGVNPNPNINSPPVTGRVNPNPNFTGALGHLVTGRVNPQFNCDRSIDQNFMPEPLGPWGSQTGQHTPP